MSARIRGRQCLTKRVYMKSWRLRWRRFLLYRILILLASTKHQINKFSSLYFTPFQINLHSDTAQRKLTFASGIRVTCANTSSVSGSAYNFPPQIKVSKPKKCSLKPSMAGQLESKKTNKITTFNCTLITLQRILSGRSYKGICLSAT